MQSFYLFFSTLVPIQNIVFKFIFGGAIIPYVVDDALIYQHNIINLYLICGGFYGACEV